MYKHIIFDIDGTLIDTKKATLFSLQRAIKEINKQWIKLEELNCILGIPGLTALQNMKIPNAKQIIPTWNKFYQEYSEENRIFEGVEELLLELQKRNYIMGIVTSRNRYDYLYDNVFDIIRHFFKVSVCKEDTILHKPNGEPLVYYLKKANGSNENSLFIGDTDYDQAAANNAKIKFAFAGWSGNTQCLIADYRLKKPMDLIGIL